MACNSTLDNLPDGTWSTTLGVFMCFITVLATLENLGVLIIIWRYKVLRTQSNKILSSLAVADMLTGCTVAPLHAVQYLNKNALHNCGIEMARRFLSTFLIGASACALGFVSFDRCMHLVRLKNFKLKNSRLYGTIFFCYFIPVFIICFRFIPGDAERVYSALIITILVVIFSVIIVSYAALIFSLHNYTRKSTESIRKQSEDNEKRAAVTIIIIVTFYIIMIVPVGVYHGLYSSAKLDKFQYAKLYSLTMLFAIANSVVNPLIYCYRTRTLKKYIHRFFQDLAQSQPEDESADTNQSQF